MSTRFDIPKQWQTAAKRVLVRCAPMGFSFPVIIGFSLLLPGHQVFAAPAPQASAGAQAVALPGSTVPQPGYVVLRGNTRPEANARNDRGRVADNLPLNHLMLLLQRTPEQEQALEQFIRDLHDPASPLFHQWITAEEFGLTYGASPADVARVTSWLAAQGFTVNLVYPSQMVIDFTGTAGQIRKAFLTEIHNLIVNGVPHIANMSDPQIPVDLASTVAGIVSLNDFRPRAGPRARADYTLGNGYYAIVPGDLAKIYNFTPAFTAGYSGQGQTIVLLEPTDLYATTDWATFRNTFGLNSAYPSGTLTTVHPAPSSGTNNCTDPGVTSADDEATLDAEWSSAAAPSATIEVASCANTTTNAGQFIALQNLLSSGTPPTIVSLSYSYAETLNGASGNSYINNLFAQAATAGVSVFVSTGDHGAAEADWDVGDAYYAEYGITVSGLASTPYNVAVGGTDFADTYEGTNATYWNSSNATNYSSAKSYIPEIPWNDSCASVLLADYHKVSTTYGSTGLCNNSTYSAFVALGGGGGGPSGCATGVPDLPGAVSGTCAGYAKPTWQSGFLGNPNDGVRDIPDVSLFASPGFWGHYYVFCFTDPSNGGTTNCTGPPSTWSGAGGTSFAAPIMAGIQGLINQATGQSWGNPDPSYYALAQAEYGSTGTTTCKSSLGNTVASNCVFYDVTQIPLKNAGTGTGGDNDQPCWGMNCYLPSGTYGVLSNAGESLTSAYVSGWSGSWSSPPTCAISGGGGTGATCSASVTGVIFNVSLTADGSGYTSEPTCTLGAPPSGTTATCSAYICTNGQVCAIGIDTFGSGYTSQSQATCAISGGGGSGAECAATYFAGGLTLSLTSGGSGYTTLPACVLTGGGGGSNATCYALALNTSNGYAPAFTAGTGWDFATGIGTVNVSNLVNSFTSGPSLSPSSLAFTQVANSTSPAQTVTMTNTGAGSLGISTVTISGTNASNFAKSADTCTGATLAKTATCTVGLTFTPNATGSFSAQLNFNDYATNTPQTVTLSGTGVTGAPAVTFSAAPTFPSEPVGTTSPAQTVTVTNTGSASLTFTVIATTGPFAIATAGTTCSTSSPVAAPGTCTVALTFTPTSVGTASGSLVLTDNASNSPQSLSLSATGTGAVAGVSPSSLTFSAQWVNTTSAAQTVTVSNTGNANLTFTALTATSPFAIATTGATCSTSSPVAASGSCTINVTFTPTAPGSFTGTLTITDNGVGTPGSTQTVSLSGTGMGPWVSLSPSSLSFSAQIVGTSSTQTVTLSNTGNAALTISSIIASGVFSQTNTCGATLSAGGNCAISVTFKPVASGTVAGTLSISDNAAGTRQAVALAGTGIVFTVGPQPPTPPKPPASPSPGTRPLASLSSSSLTFGAQNIGTTGSQMLTLTNTGKASLAISSIAIGGDFSQTNTCGGHAAAGSSCTINVTFKPTTKGTRRGALTIIDNNDGVAGSRQVVTLSGTGGAAVRGRGPTLPPPQPTSPSPPVSGQTKS